MPRVSFPTRSGRAKAEEGEAPTATEPTEPAKAAESKATEATESKATEGKPKAPTKAGNGAKAPEPNMQERMEGLQGWMAELERKQGRITYFGALVLLIAIAAAGAALYFGLTTRSDSATKSDLDALTKRVDALESAVAKNSKDTQNALNASIAQLQSSISSLQKQQSQAAANISTLQSQASSGAFKKGAAAGTTVPGTTTATTTTTPKKP